VWPVFCFLILIFLEADDDATLFMGQGLWRDDAKPCRRLRLGSCRVSHPVDDNWATERGSKTTFRDTNDKIGIFARTIIKVFGSADEDHCFTNVDQKTISNKEI